VQEQKPEESRAASETSQTVVRIHPDVIAVASPEIAGLPGWIGGLFLAAALTAALSGAAALLAVLGAFVSYDIYLRLIDRHASVKRQRTVSQVSMCLAVILAGGLALYVRASVAQLVAWGFGVGAATFFPVLVLGVFWKRATMQGAMAGMVFGAVITVLYIIHVRAFDAGPWLFGISAEGVGAVAAVLSLIVTVAVSLRTPRPPGEIQELVQRLHYSPDVTTTREFG